jgi:crotonobetainyl-CoA:carnitine CoA-transferase CaiB-like acyl-CoA transferase
MLGLQNEREWAVFCEKVLQQPGLAADDRYNTNAKRSAARETLRKLIVDSFASLTTAQVAERLDDAQIANARVNTMHEVWQHPQLAARQRWAQVDTPAGPMPALLPPGSWQASPPRMDAVPALGQHTDAILAELGQSPEGIAALHAQRVV